MFLIRLVFVLILVLWPIVDVFCDTISVVGNRFKDSANNTIVLHGVVRAGSEYACVNGWGFFDSTITTLNDDIEVPFFKSWRMNAVTIPLNEDCWLGINGVLPEYSGINYINAIKHEVLMLEANGIYPVLSLFFTDNGTTSPALSQKSMPDSAHTPIFWQSVAKVFKTDLNVIFKLKEESFPAGNADTLAAWKCWHFGDVQFDASGSLTPVSSISNCSEGFSTVGMQSLVNIIRGTGSTNVISLTGIQYANTLTHFLDFTYRIKDTLLNPQLAVSADIYPDQNPCASITCYTAQYAPIIAVMPFFAGEIGESIDGSDAATTAVDTLMTWLDGRGAGYSAWAWNTYGGSLQLITAYGTGTAKSSFGTDFKAHISTLH